MSSKGLAILQVISILAALAFVPAGAALAQSGCAITADDLDQLQVINSTSVGRKVTSAALASSGEQLAIVSEYHPQFNKVAYRVELAELDSLARPSFLTLIEGSNLISKIAYSPNGELVYNAGYQVFVLDTITHERLRTFSGSTSILTFEIGSQGLLIAAAENQSVSVWNFETGSRVFSFGKFAAPVASISLSVDEELLAVGSMDGMIRVWDLNAGELLLELQAHSLGARALAFTSSGRLISGGGDAQLKMWDIATGELLEEHPSLGGTVISLAISNGERVAWGTMDGRVRMAPLDELASPQTLDGHEGLVVDLRFSVDEEKLVSVGTDWTVSIWESETGSLLASPIAGWPVELDPVFSPDGESLFFVSGDFAARPVYRADIYLSEIEELPARFANLVGFVALGDGVSLGMATLHGISLYNTKTGEVSVIESSLGGMIGSLFAARFGLGFGIQYLPKSDTLYWESFYALDSYSVSKNVSDEIRIESFGNVGPFAFFPDGRHIVRESYVTDSFEILDTQEFDQYSWSLAVGKVETLGWFSFSRASFNNQGNQVLISGTQRDLVGLYDVSLVDDPKLQISWNGVDGMFSPISDLIAVANLAGGIVFYDSLTRQQTGQLVIENEQIEKIFFSPGGCSLLAVSGDGELISIAVPEE